MTGLKNFRLSALTLTVLVSVGLFLAFVCSSTEAAKELAGAWTFEDGKGDQIKDVSGNNFHGKLQGGGKWVKDGPFGGALELNGTDAWVEVVDAPEFEFPKGTDFTLAIWFKMTIPGPGSPPMFVTKGYHGDQVQPWYALYYAGEGKAVTGHASVFVRNNTGDNLLVVGKTLVNDGKWHHIAGVRNGDELKFYVDGKMENSKKGADLDIGTNNQPLAFGRHLTVRHLGAVIDEVVIYRKALSDAEIKSLKDSGIQAALSVEPKEKLTTTWGFMKSR
jgi:hypothetical protein